MSRGGWGVTFGLSYNSQLWKQDPEGQQKVGIDVGYGFGWKLQAGSVRQVYSGAQTSHYVYSDATGAEYRLDVNSGGVWTSKEGVWVSYDTTYSPARLYWPDGSWWEMGSVSAGAEQDAGTQYPTRMWDTNGNWIEVGYAAGAGLGGTNSSARITRIRDTRPEAFDTLTYVNGHLSGVTSNIGAGDNYTFGYSASQPLNSPFTPSIAAGTGVMLQGVTRTGIGTTTSFEYWPGSGEMTRLTTALGGTLRWEYKTYTFASGTVLREVLVRYAKAGPAANELRYVLILDPNSASQHAWATLVDQGANTSKVWWFGTEVGSYRGLAWQYEERNEAAPGSPLLRKQYGWAATGSGNVYVSSVVTTLDPGTQQAQTKTTQVVDNYGNVTQQQDFRDDFNIPANGKHK